MSGILKSGSSGLLNDITNEKKYCTDTFGSEWDVNFREIKILNIPFYVTRCEHKKYSGSDNFCCDNFLKNNKVFGEEGVNNNFKETCNADQNNITSCNKGNKKNICIKKIIDGESLTVPSDNLCGKFISTPGNN